MQFNASRPGFTDGANQGVAPSPLPKHTGPVDWERIARALWALLDDIDTAGDMFKPEWQDYERYVQGKANARNAYLHSPDGHELVPTPAASET